MSLALSAMAFISLVTFEGYSARAYPDPTYGWKIPTVGFGTTGKDITKETVLPPVAAMTRAMADIQVFESGVKRCVAVPITQGQYDSYVMFSYNVGTRGFCKSTLVKLQNEAKDIPACNQILKWRFSNGFDCSVPDNKVCPGLWTRRQFENKLCLRDL